MRTMKNVPVVNFTRKKRRREEEERKEEERKQAERKRNWELEREIAIARMNVALQTIPWDPKCDEKELLGRLGYAALRALVDTDSNCEAMSVLARAMFQEEGVISAVQKNVPSLANTTLPHPSLEELAVLKDVCRITDRTWPLVVKTFHLEEYGTIHYIKQQKKEWNAESGPEPTEGGRGYQYPFKQLVKKLVEENGVESGSKIRLKIAFDGATATARKRRQMECGTIEFLLPEYNLSFLKSSRNCHQWLLYFGGENAKTLREEIGKRAMNTINKWAAKGIEGKEIKVGDSTYHVELFLTCDMKALCVVLGMNECYKHNASYRCPWCSITRDKLHEFTEISALKDQLAFRSFDDCNKIWNLLERKHWAKSTRKNKAVQNKGYINKPVLKFQMNHVVPCLMHAIMAILRKFIYLLETLMSQTPDLQSIFVEKFEAIGVHLKKAEVGETFKVRVKRSRFNRAEYLKILEGHNILFEELAKRAVGEPTKDKVLKAQAVWNKFHGLCTLAMQEKVEITEQEWLTEALQFGRMYVETWSKADVTTYLHVFIFHFGYFLEKYVKVHNIVNIDNVFDQL